MVVCNNMRRHNIASLGRRGQSFGRPIWRSTSVTVIVLHHIGRLDIVTHCLYIAHTDEIYSHAPNVGLSRAKLSRAFVLAFFLRRAVVLAWFEPRAPYFREKSWILSPLFSKHFLFFGETFLKLKLYQTFSFLEKYHSEENWDPFSPFSNTFLIFWCC